MIKLKPRHILATFGVIVMVVVCYVGWQLYKGQQMANQYTADAQKLAQGSGNGSVSSNSPTPSSKEVTPETPNQTSSSPNTSPLASSSSESQPDSSTPDSPESQPNSSAPSSNEYKKLMSSPYHQTLQAMSDVKENTLALQKKTMSLSAYKASILQSQAAFAAAEAFVRANPPSEERLNASYQEFLSGISLAKQAMGVVLNGVSALSPSSLYAARKMGLNAQQQVVEAYTHF